MDRRLTAVSLLFTCAGVLFGQNEPKKANARPEATPTPAAIEPFDRADIKAMAGKCVTLDTEAGTITMELFPESAPETVRNFLNLVATGALDTTTFSRVV